MGLYHHTLIFHSGITLGPPYSQGSATMDSTNHGLKMLKKKKNSRDFPGLRLYTSTAGGTGSIPDQGTKILPAAEVLSQSAATTEPMYKYREPMHCNKDPEQPT